MTLSHWIVYGLLAAAALVAALLIYGRLEPPGRGRPVLALLRGGAVAVVLLLFFDPLVPGGQGAGTAGRRLLLLDASLSMNARGGPGDSTAWSRAVARARRAVGTSVLLFGDAARHAAPDSLPPAPSDAHTLLAPALRAAAESGARSVVVLSDGRFEDAAKARRVAQEAGVAVRVQRVSPDSAAADHALVEVDAPAWAEAGKPLRITTGVLGALQPLQVRVSGGGQSASATTSTATHGRLAVTTLTLTARAPKGGGMVRYDLAVGPADGTPADDHRSVYVYVAAAPAGVVLVSFRPNFEPRFLQPILADALGLPARGFLRMAAGRYDRMGTALTAGRPASEAEVRAAVSRADLVVLHGLSATAPAWARAVADSAPRVIILPAASQPPGHLPVALPPATPGDWYLTTQPPASPLAPYLAGIEADSVPPLPELRATAAPAGTWPVLDVRRDRVGPAAPALLVGVRGHRRWAVAAGVGYWRWAFTGGAAREAYRALWAAVAGWIMRNSRGVAPLAVRPVPFAVPRGQPVAWVAPGLSADSLAIALTDSAGAAVADTVVRPAGDTAWTLAPAPGNYHYAATAYAGGRRVAAASGPLTVETYSPDYVRPVAAWDSVGGRGARVAASAGDRSLHATPWAYLALVLLLCGEWVLRRRWGLR